MRFALTAYSLAHQTGYLPTRDGRSCSTPLDAIGVMNAAVEIGLGGIEFPLPTADRQGIERLRDALRERGLFVVTDYLVVDAAAAGEFVAFLQASARLGARIVRATLSNVLCGDRRSLAHGWDHRLECVARRLREVLPVAQELGLCVTLENHQDAATEDFVRLAERVDGHPCFGVCFDTGNPLAVGEGPVESARALLPLIRHVHLKDYTIHFSDKGYRLVRCAAGTGVVDFSAILELLRASPHDLTPGIEIAWHATRTIPVLDPAWWSHYSPRDATSLLPALRLLWEKGRPADEPYCGAWERGEASDVVCREEWDLLRRSVRYFRDQFSGGGGGIQPSSRHVSPERAPGAGDRRL